MGDERGFWSRFATAFLEGVARELGARAADKARKWRPVVERMIEQRRQALVDVLIHRGPVEAICGSCELRHPELVIAGGPNAPCRKCGAETCFRRPPGMWQSEVPVSQWSPLVSPSESSGEKGAT